MFFQSLDGYGVCLATRLRNHFQKYSVGLDYIDGFGLRETDGKKSILKIGFSHRGLKVLKGHTFSNKGVPVCGFGWIAFLKTQNKILLITGPENESLYRSVILHSENKWDSPGETQFISHSVIERAPDEFQFYLELPPTIDYV